MLIVHPRSQRRRVLRFPSALNPADLQTLSELLADLSKPERLAIARFYCDGAPPEIAIIGTGISIDRFRDLRNDVRGRFFALTGRIAR